jgi:hypothetical protein
MKPTTDPPGTDRLTCRTCLKIFTPRRKWQVSCSLKCTDDWNNHKKKMRQAQVEAEMVKLLKRL